MAIDINELTQAVTAELRNGATDLGNVPVASSVTDDDMVLGQSGSSLKKIKVAAIAAKGKPGDPGTPGADAVVYRLLPEALVYKSDTKSVALSLLKTEGETTAAAELPEGWVVQVTWETAAGLMQTATHTTLAAIDPNSLKDATSVRLELYTSDPQAGSSGGARTAVLVDSATLLLVKDGEQGEPGSQGPKGDKGDAGSLILHPFDDLAHFRLSAMDYETGIATLQATPVGVNEGDFCAIIYDTSDVIGRYTHLPDSNAATVQSNNSRNGVAVFGYITAIEGSSVTTTLILKGKGTLKQASSYMLVCFGASDPTDDLQITLPDGFKGKPLRIEIQGQAMNKDTSSWDNWSVKFGNAKKLVEAGADNGHVSYVHEIYTFNGEQVGYTDLTYATGINISGNYRRRESLYRQDFDITTATRVIVPWQFGLPNNVIIISLL